MLQDREVRLFLNIISPVLILAYYPVSIAELLSPSRNPSGFLSLRNMGRARHVPPMTTTGNEALYWKT
jgi:hypothetical protein